MNNKPLKEPHYAGGGGTKHPERRPYDEIHERILARLKAQSKGRRSRWRPLEP